MSILFFVPFYSEPIIENSNKLIYIKNINIILRSDYARGEFSHGDLHFSYIFHEIEKCNMHFASWCIHTPISLNGALMKSVLHAFYLHARIHFISVSKCVFNAFLMHFLNALDLYF